VDNADDCDDSDPRVVVCDDEGGTDEGGTDEGGTDEGGTDEGGTDEGGTDEGGSTTGETGDTGAAADSDALEESSTGSSDTEQSREDVEGCGCASTSSGPSRRASGLGALLMLVVFRRRSCRGGGEHL
jgi:MYXO-CTERM domain-containing protein